VSVFVLSGLGFVVVECCRELVVVLVQIRVGKVVHRKALVQVVTHTLHVLVELVELVKVAAFEQLNHSVNVHRHVTIHVVANEHFPNQIGHVEAQAHEERNEWQPRVETDVIRFVHFVRAEQ
jgi:hypothetical protein